MSFSSFKKEMKKAKEQADKEKRERQTIYSFEKMSEDFSKRKSEYLEDAKKALSSGDQLAYERNVALIKNIMFQKAQIEDMLINYKMARDLRDMGKLRESFATTLNTVMKDVDKMNNNHLFNKMGKNFYKGMNANTRASETLQKLLTMNGVAFSNYADRFSDVDEREIKKIIESELDKDSVDLDARLSDFENEILSEVTPKTVEKPKMASMTVGVEAPKRVEAPSKNFERLDNVPKAEIKEPTVKKQAPLEGFETFEKSNTNRLSTYNPTSVATTSSFESPKQPTQQVQEDKNKDAQEKEASPEDAVLKNGKGFENNEFNFIWDNLPTIGFEDIAGLESVKEAVKMKVLLPLMKPELFEGYAKQNGGGLLLYGPPGTGKTMVAAAIAKEIGAKFCSVKPSDLLHQGAGMTEKAVRALFAQARSFPCSVIYFDEMDSISPKSTKSQYAKQLRSEFLSQLQGVESYGKDNKNILFLIAATNKPWDIDSAFLRPGRFGTRIYVGLPDDEARRYIIQRSINKIEEQGKVIVCEDIDLDSIVSRSEGFNGSDVSALIDSAKDSSLSRTVKTGFKSLNQSDFDNAFERVTSSVQRDDIEKLMEWQKTVN